MLVCVCGVCVCVCVCVCLCVSVCAGVTEVYDTMSCLPIVSEQQPKEASISIWGGSPMSFFTQNTCWYCMYFVHWWLQQSFA